jgi:hypothetical protein
VENAEIKKARTNRALKIEPDKNYLAGVAVAAVSFLVVSIAAAAAAAESAAA